MQFPSPLYRRKARTAVLALALPAVLLGTGCVTVSGGPLVRGPGVAPAAQGAPVGNFKMADGSTGFLYLHNGRYSLAIPGYRSPFAVEGRNVTVRGSEVVGDRTVLLLQKSDYGCALETHVAAFRGQEVLSWIVGDCRNPPAVTVETDRMLLDFPAGTSRITRFIYENGRLDRTQIALDSRDGQPQQASRATPQGQPGAAQPSRGSGPAAPLSTDTPTAAGQGGSPGPRFMPRPPIEVGTSAVVPTSAAPTPSPAAPARSSSTSRTQATAPVVPSAPRDLQFPRQEQKPVRIILDQ